jgi:Mn-dependent DtxR family transcriptional regulator
MTAGQFIELMAKIDTEYDSRAGAREMAVFAYLIENPGEKMSMIAADLRQSQSVVSRALKKMQEKGFVKKDELGNAYLTEKAEEMFKDFLIGGK